MKDAYIENLIVKFMTKSISAEELDQLSEWISVKENEKYFFDFIKINYAIDVNYASFNQEKAKTKFLKEINLKENYNKGTKKSNLWKYAVAATIAILISLPFFLNQEQSNLPVEIHQPILPGSDKATLTLEDGETITLEKGKIYTEENINSDGENIIYKSDTNAVYKPIAYNFLTVPKGGQFFVQLSDSTKVWLNSDSKLKYPKQFRENKIREVELVYGEAYFEVSPSTAHNGAKFKVIAPAQAVEVLGTEFNIKAYSDEQKSFTTLVEGKVLTETEKSNQLLSPGQQAVIENTTGIVTVEPIDVYNETSWKQGVFSFKQKSLLEITKVLSRWYNIDFEFKNENLKLVKFIGVLKKKQPLDDILNLMQNTAYIKHYEIKNQKIILE